MGVYDGLAYFKKRHVKIIMCPLAIDGEVLDDRLLGKGDNFVLRINEELSLEERVKVVIHEAIHFGEPFIGNLFKYGRSHNMPEHLYKKQEEEIEQLTEAVYKHQLVLIAYLREKVK